jgi:hypothetical protein
MSTYIYGHIPILVYTFLHQFSYTCLHISTPIYLLRFTYCYAYIRIHVGLRPIHVYILPSPYTSRFFPSSTLIYLYKPSYYFIGYRHPNAPYKIYIHLRRYCCSIYIRPYMSYTLLYISTPIYALYMITYFYVHIRIYIPIYAYTFLHS